MRHKTLMLSILFCCCTIASYGQPKPFELTIHVGGIQLYEVGLEFPIDNQLTDEITISKLDHGVYLAKGKLDYPILASILIKKKRGSVNFFIEPGVQQIHTHIDSLRKPIIVEGSKSNEEYLHQFLPALSAYKTAADALSKDYNTLYGKYDTKIPPHVEDSILVLHERNNDLRNVLVQKYVKAHPTSYVGFWMLYDLFRTYSYKEAYEKAYASLSPKLQRNIDGRTLKNSLAVTKQLLTGKPFPQLKLVDSLGVDRSLGASLARYTLVDFWYSNCGPCIAQFEKLKELYGTFHPKGFTIVGVSTDKLSKEVDWKKVMVKYALPWTQLWDKDGQQAGKFNINMFPTNFLLDEKGNIVRRDLELFQLEEYLNTHLK